ncbi:uncharacterized protein LOC132279503 [Cornus florida]|uniref:uncharacterized protein LOC132279503 n=1 Tax=Cornus florida TaxID=4283 RepID=UPI00289777FF|nr:uncharacterized protein LOC132279503 [Cornus florida]
MDKSEVDKKLAKHIILNNISFNVVQIQSFIDFVKSVAEFRSTYKLPSYSTLRTKLIPNSRTEVEAYIGNVKKTWVATGCTLMSDIWSIYLKDIMSSVIEDIGPNHVVQFITDNASNFESAGDMLIEVEDGLRLLVASSEWRGLDYNKRGMGLKVASIIQSVEFWSKGKEVIQTLEPLVKVLRLVDGDGSTAGYLYEAMERAKETIKQCCCINQANYMQIWVLFEKRRIENVIHPIHAAAAFLNPTFMCSEDFRENREMKDVIDFMLGNFIIEEEKEDFIRELQFYRVWWDYCGDCLPVLQKYAIRILSQPCSSSSCERNWSAWEATQI